MRSLISFFSVILFFLKLIGVEKGRLKKGLKVINLKLVSSVYKPEAELSNLLNTRS